METTTNIIEERIMQAPYITVDVTSTGEPIVFVNGYALVERDFNIARKLALTIGQRTIPVTWYNVEKGEPPVTEDWKV